MIIYENSGDYLIEKIEDDILELKKYKIAYKQKINICDKSSNKIKNMMSDEYKLKNIDSISSINDRIKNCIKLFNEQIKEINERISDLCDLKLISDVDKLKMEIESYNKKYKILKSKFINNSIYEEKIILDFLKIEDLNNKEITKEIDDNPVLLISEIQNKVILPYSGEEVESILNNKNNEYKTHQEVIEKEFTRNLGDFKNVFESRFKEAYDLATKRENYSKLDGIKLGIELYGKRYLHPAIIAACRNTDELDVYLDCLEKNELNEFKIFEIKYELYPITVDNSIYNHNNYFKKIINLFKGKKSKLIIEQVGK